MTLKEYFQAVKGTGILATADDAGMVDAAVYSRPHITADGTLAFIMRERLTLSNLQTNPHATYLFVESSSHLKGVRLFMKKIGQDQDKKLIDQMTRRSLTPEEDRAAGPKHIVYFSLEKALSLVGPNEAAMKII